MIKIENYCKSFGLRNGSLKVLKNVSLDIAKGEKFGVIGYSGAGKSTLVRCINFLETPDSGRITIEGCGTIESRGGVLFRDGRKMRESELARLRSGIGIIFQHFNLLDRSTAFDNVAYPLKYRGKGKSEITARVLELLDLVGLRDKADAYPCQLSGGQKQRVAIARALANDPQILLCDEATSALDPEATQSILNLLNELNARLGITIVIITHEMAVVKSVCDRVAVLDGGEIVEEGTVYEVFSNPKTPIAAKFAESASSLSKINELINSGSSVIPKGVPLYKLTFGKSVSEPVVSEIAKKFDVKFNIILANVEAIGNEAFGAMVVSISGDSETVRQSIEYLRQNNIRTEVIA